MKTLRFIKIVPKKSTLKEISFEGNKINKFDRKLKADIKKTVAKEKQRRKK